MPGQPVTLAITHLNTFSKYSTTAHAAAEAGCERAAGARETLLIIALRGGIVLSVPDLVFKLVS